MLRCAYRTRECSPTKIQPARFFNLDSNGESKLARAFYLRTTRQCLRQLAEHFRGFVIGRHFRNHLSVVRRRPKKLWLERNDREWLAFQRLGEVSGRDFRPLRHAHLIETVMRPVIVRSRTAQQIDHVLGIAQVGEIGSGDHKNIGGADQNSLRPGRPLMRDVEDETGNRAA